MSEEPGTGCMLPTFSHLLCFDMLTPRRAQPSPLGPMIRVGYMR